MKKIVLKVKTDNFCDWYLDEDTINCLTEKLVKNGSVSHTDMTDNLCYLPFNLVENQKDVRSEDLDAGCGYEINNLSHYKIKLI